MRKNAEYLQPEGFYCQRSSLHTPKLFLLLLLCLRYPIDKDDQETGRIEKYREWDIEFFSQFLSVDLPACPFLDGEFEFTYRNLVDIFNSLVGIKHTHYGKLKIGGNEMVVKYFGYGNKIDILQKHLVNKRRTANISEATRSILINSHRCGFHFCPLSALERFVTEISNNTTGKYSETWAHLFVNSETIILPVLNQFGCTTVPKYYGHCGFMLFESYEGLSLNQLNRKKCSFATKLKIALKLLDIASEFTNGFNGYRIYFTDLTLDNIVYNEKTEKLFVVDLDAIVMIDTVSNRSDTTSVEISSHNDILKHEKIECHGCFAYKESDLCNASIVSDINIFASCQLLNEDLYENEEEGYLKPIPTSIDQKWPDLQRMLYTCVQCQDENCLNRFVIVSQLRQLIKEILSESDALIYVYL